MRPAFCLDEFKTFFSGSAASARPDVCEMYREQGITGIMEGSSSGGSKQKCIGDRLLVLFWYMASLDKYAAIADRLLVLLWYMANLDKYAAIADRLLVLFSDLCTQ